MIDYVKIEVFLHQFSKPILENPLLKFDKKVSADGEIMNQTAKYKNMDIFVQGEALTISGSLHKLWNGDDTNYNDFPFLAIRQTISDLANALYFSPSEARVLGLEYGVNITPVLPVTEILRRTICYDWREPLESMKGIVGAGNGKQANLSNYRLKIYDKGLPNHIPNLLRVENKTLRSVDLEGTGVNTLWDLTNVAVLAKLGNKLMRRFDNILLYEEINETLLNEKQRLFYCEAKNPNYWKELERWKRDDRKKGYWSLVEKYAVSGVKGDLRKQIFEKWEMLQKCNVFAWFCERLLQQKCNVFAWFEEPAAIDKEAEDCNIFALLKLQNVTFCLTTRFDISGQKKGSRFVSEKTVRANPEVAAKLDEGRKKHKRKHEAISENARLAKRSRNEWSNKGNNTRKSIEKLKSKGELFLFSLEETISPQKLALVERFRGTKWEVKVR